MPPPVSHPRHMSFITPIPVHSHLTSSANHSIHTLLPKPSSRRQVCTQLLLHQPSSTHQSSVQQPSVPQPSVPPQPPTSSSSPDIFRQSLDLLEWPQLTDYVIRYASTPQGRLAMTTPIGLPIPSTRQQSEFLLSQTRAAYHLEYVLCKPLDFTGIRNVTQFVTLAAKGRVLTGPQLVDVANILQAARRIRRHIDSAEPSASTPSKLTPLLDLVASFRTWPEVEQQITTDLDDYGDVQESADPELRAIRTSLKNLLADIRAKLNGLMARHADAVQDRVITSRYDRFVIPVKTSHKAVFRRGIVHDASSTGSTAYIEPASVKALNDQARQLAAREKARVHAVLRRLTFEFVAPIADDVGNLDVLLAELDAAVARARCSKSLSAVDVIFDDQYPLRLMGVRHPLLSWKAMTEIEPAQQEQPSSAAPNLSRSLPQEPAWKQNVVPSSYILSDDIRCVCVTGPNTGGKTLSLKTIGVSVLMVKAGLFVPATLPHTRETSSTSSTEDLEDHAGSTVIRMPYFDAVLADIGDDQSLVQSLSTFSGHVRRIKMILAASTSKSLVLLDEIGSGTDPAEGAALGMAVLRHLAVEKRAALTFATTHHGELKTLKYALDESARFFENASVEFDDVKMAPTYRLIWGIPGRSNALVIAERLGLRPDILEEARFLLSGSSESDGGSKRVDIEKMISSLERDKRAAEFAREQSEHLLRETNGLKMELQERLERLRLSESNLRKDQKAAMDVEVKEARKQIAKMIKDMQQGGGSAQAAAKASGRLKNMILPGSSPKSEVLGRPHTRPVQISEELHIGDRIIVPRLGGSEVGIVGLVSKKEVAVAMGGMKVKVKVTEIESVVRDPSSQGARNIPQRRPTGGIHKERLSVRTAANTIDIRGERVDGAEAKVDQALDKALAMGSLWVIHGHGTGRLRNGVRKFLTSHHLVERIEDAEQSDGGTGVTVAYLS